ncbi:hypothetical protein F4814DRAFT_412379 [Daldinia grandis]|nr:hypothetical protein F4814DRAFT_412379 [Daldinia grandis]
MGLSIQVRTAVATSLLVFSASASASSSSHATMSASTQRISTSTVSLMRSSHIPSSAISEHAMPSNAAITNSNAPIVLAVVPAGNPVSRRDVEHKHPKHSKHHKDSKHHHKDSDHHHKDSDHHHKDSKHHHKDHKHHDHHDHPDHPKHSKHPKHHDSGKGFVGTAPANPVSCTDATTFYLTDGAISSNGEYVMTGRGVSYEPFTASSARGDHVAGKFGVEDGYLRWYDDGFYGGRARYCQMPGHGQVYVTYHADNTWPNGCEEVDLEVGLESWCRNGEYVPGGGEYPEEDDHGYETGYATTTGYTVHTGYGTSSHYPAPISYKTASSYKAASSHPAPTYPVLSAPTPTSHGIYPTYASPTGQLCVETPLSWVLGSHTFIRDEL